MTDIEKWRTLKPGDIVKVVQGISRMEKELIGRVFTLSRFSKPHRYAVITNEHGSWHVHPECLILIPRCTCKSEWCNYDT